MLISGSSRVPTTQHRVHRWRDRTISPSPKSNGRLFNCWIESVPREDDAEQKDVSNRCKGEYCIVTVPHVD